MNLIIRNVSDHVWGKLNKSLKLFRISMGYIPNFGYIYRKLCIWCRSCKAVSNISAQCSWYLWECKNILFRKNSTKGIPWSFLCRYRWANVFVSDTFCFLFLSFKQVSNIIVKELGNNPKVYVWDGQGKYLLRFRLLTQILLKKLEIKCD